MGRVEGKVAFVTGAARGQGRSHALRLAEEGADIIAVDVSEQIDTVLYPMASAEDLAETVRQVEALDRRIIAREADVRDSDALAEAVKEGVAEFGRLDIVLANAGISTIGPTLEMSDQVWEDMIDVNLTGVWRTVKAAVPHVIDGGRGGSVVLTSSLATSYVYDNIAHYSAAKAGVVMLMKVLAKELAPHNIRVNTVHPTTVATDMVLNAPTLAAFRPDLAAPVRADLDEVVRTIHQLPVGSIDPQDITETVLHLVSDSSRYITGTTHIIDAGASL